MSGPTESFAISTALAQAPRYRIVYDPNADWRYPYRVEVKGWFFWHDVTGEETLPEAEQTVRNRVENELEALRVAQMKRDAPKRVVETFDAQGRKVP